MTWRIRPAQENDVPMIKVIEDGSFPRPWDEDLFRIIGAWRGSVPIEHNRLISMNVAESDEEIIERSEGKKRVEKGDRLLF